MDPIKAAKLGVDPDEVKITCSHRHRGMWIAWMPDEERGEYILASSHDVYELCWWRSQIRMVLNGEIG